jgi:putative hydrolases of HD superfamily
MDADLDRWLDLLLQAGTLKTMPRTGWHQRWVARPENVAAHSWGTAMIALVLAEMIEAAPAREPSRPIDRGRLLSMAILHDLTEAELSDIPKSALSHLPPGTKQAAEAKALKAMLAGMPTGGSWSEMLAEYEQEKTLEARLVRDADRLEFLLQAWVYRRASGNELLDDVRASYAGRRLATAAAQSLLDLVLRRWNT